MSKVDRDLWHLFVAIVSLDFTFVVRKMTLASIFFKKSNFQTFHHLNVLGGKFDLDVKLVWVNLGELLEQTWYALHRQIYIQSPKVISFLALKEKIYFFHIWAWQSSWLCDQDPLFEFSFSYRKESPYEIWG